MPSSSFDVPKLVCIPPSSYPCISAEVSSLSCHVTLVTTLHPVLGSAFTSVLVLHFTLLSFPESFNSSPLLGVNDVSMF